MVIGPSVVNSELPLPRTDSARLTIYSSLRNSAAQQVRGVLRATITRNGKPGIQIEQPVTLAAGEQREISFTPDEFAQLSVQNPDLWWPYTLGEPNLYDLRLEFRQYNRETDASQLRFGIRTVTQHRDQDQQFPELGKGGNFYLTVNGKDFLVRGAAYAPDLLFANDPARDAAVLQYVKDLGLNMIRFEGKFPGEHIVEMADELGIPLMFGWMCCNQWEKWPQWDDEDNRVAQDSLRSQIQMLRPHASVFVWANGSDGKPPPAVLDRYHANLSDLHWQNAVVDTVSSMTRDAAGERVWDGIHMAGPYSWRPPSYWFSGRYARHPRRHRRAGRQRTHPAVREPEEVHPRRQAVADQRRMVLPRRLEPEKRCADEYSARRRSSLRRCPTSAEEFARKAQVGALRSRRGPSSRRSPRTAGPTTR